MSLPLIRPKAVRRGEVSWQKKVLLVKSVSAVLDNLVCSQLSSILIPANPRPISPRFGELDA